MGGTKRRDFIKRTALVSAGLGLSSSPFVGAGSAAARDTNDSPADQELLLVNGRIHTMDAHDSVVSSVLIRDGRFVEVGGSGEGPRERTQVINLHGRTLIPV